MKDKGIELIHHTYTTRGYEGIEDKLLNVGLVTELNIRTLETDGGKGVID